MDLLVYLDLVTKSLLLLHTNDFDSIRDLSSRAILTPRNDAVSDLNQIALDLFSSAEPMHQLYSTTTISGGSEDDYNNFPVDYLNNLDLPGLPPSVLTLCRGALVILLRNIGYERGLCNGTRISARVLDVLVLTGKSIGKRAFIPRIPLSPSEAMLPAKLIRRQFPVRLAWALTINKAQWQTLRRALPCHLATFCSLVFRYMV